jgi:hypothetical protein
MHCSWCLFTAAPCLKSLGKFTTNKVLCLTRLSDGSVDEDSHLPGYQYMPTRKQLPAFRRGTAASSPQSSRPAQFFECLSMKKEKLYSFETFVNIYQSTRCYNAEDISLQYSIILNTSEEVNTFDFFRCFRKIAKSDCQLRYDRSSFRLSMEQLDSHWMDFDEI